MSAFPGETSAEDWDDERYLFWLTDDHGKPGLARSERKGRKNPDRVAYVFCEEHKDFEPRRRRISAAQALDFVARGAAHPEGSGE